MSYLKIHHTRNQEGLPQYEVIIDYGDPAIPERRIYYKDGRGSDIIKDVAKYLAECEGGGSHD